MKNTLVIAFLGALLALQGCAENQAEVSAEQLTVQGELLYRERIALLDDAEVVVTVSPADAGQTLRILAEQRFVSAGKQVPLPFSLTLPPSVLVDDEALQLEASITLAGQTRWRSEPLPLTLPDSAAEPLDIGTVLLRAAKDDAVVGDPEALAPLVGGEWRPTEMNGETLTDKQRLTLNFSAEGRLTGLSGCNNYMASVQLNEGRIAISQMAGTLKACEPEMMALEDRFTALLQSVAYYQLGPDGQLKLTDNNGGELIARR